MLVLPTMELGLLAVHDDVLLEASEAMLPSMGTEAPAGATKSTATLVLILARPFPSGVMLVKFTVVGPKLK